MAFDSRMECIWDISKSCSTCSRNSGEPRTIICNFPVLWMLLVRRHAEKLEALEIMSSKDWDFNFLSAIEEVNRIQFPKLIKLSLYLSHNKLSREPTFVYLKLFIAPRLTQFCCQIFRMTDWFPSYWLDSEDNGHNQYYLKKVSYKTNNLWRGKFSSYYFGQKIK